MHSYTIHSTVSVLSLHSSVFVWLLCVLCVVVVFFLPSKFYLFLLCSCSDRMVCRFESTLLKHLRSELLSLLSVDPHSTSLTIHLVVVVFCISFSLWHFTYIHFFLKFRCIFCKLIFFCVCVVKLLLLFIWYSKMFVFYYLSIWFDYVFSHKKNWIYTFCFYTIQPRKGIERVLVCLCGVNSLLF